MNRIRLRVSGALVAVGIAASVFGFTAPAQAAAGQWDELGWYQYKSSCDAEGKKLVNQSKTDVYTDWMCLSDSPGYRLYIFQKY